MSCSEAGQVLSWPYVQCEMCPPGTVSYDGLCESCETGFRCMRSETVLDGGILVKGVSYPPDIDVGYHPIYNTSMLMFCPRGHDNVQRCKEGGICAEGYTYSAESYTCKTCDEVRSFSYTYVPTK